MSVHAEKDPACELLKSLVITRSESVEEAGLWICSLPLPVGAPRTLTLDGRRTYAKGLGQWPGVYEEAPRRLLMVADGGDTAPATLALVDSLSEAAATTAISTTEPPTARMRTVEQSTSQKWLWERSSCVLDYQGQELEIRLGLKHGGETRWWEACMLEVEEETAFCRVVHMAGPIPQWVTTEEMLHDPARQGYEMPGLHEHHWLMGHLWMRLYANGVVEIIARHENNRWVDDGLPLDDVVPVIAFRGEGAAALLGDYDGSVTDWEIGGARLDMTEAARLATPDRPGVITQEGEWLLYQPYAGVEVYSGRCAEQLLGRPWIWLAEEKHFPKGMARSVRFSASLGSRSPKIVRYLAPYWWYGLCQEIQQDSLLTVSDRHDEMLDAQRDWLHVHAEPGGFEDGSIPRGAPQPPIAESPKPRYECGWEGDASHGMLMLAWRTGDWTDYNIAIRNIYHFTDVVVDHASNLVRMHGYPPTAFAQPGYRVIGTIMGYLETGDPYLLDSGERVIECAHRNHLNVWPKPAVGRDACYIRGAVLLYRYFDNKHFLKIAKKGTESMVLTQREDGSFGDQCGGAGIHAYGIHITKPWMALLGNMPLLDYLEVCPDDDAVSACVLKTAKWLMAIRFEHENGVTGWSYQHNYGGKPDFYVFASQEWTTCPGTKSNWHMDNFARVLGYAALKTGDPAYIEAYEESARANETRGGNGDHSIAASQLCLPRLQQWLWQPRWTAKGLTVKPFRAGGRTPTAATIATPAGPVQVAWTADGQVTAPAGVTVETA